MLSSAEKDLATLSVPRDPSPSPDLDSVKFDHVTKSRDDDVICTQTCCLHGLNKGDGFYLEDMLFLVMYAQF